jgi:hypothetical protein
VTSIANIIDILIRARGADQVRSEVGKTQDAVKGLDKSLSGIGSNNGATTASSKMQQFGKILSDTDTRGAALRSTLQTLGAGTALAGLNMMANGLVTAGVEAGNVDAKLTAMLRTRGESGALDEINEMADRLSQMTGKDDDLFKDAASHLLSFGLNAQQISQIMPGLTGQADTMGQSLESVADSFGRAFASGNAGALTRSGVVLSQAAKDSIEAAKATSEAAGQTELFNQVLQSYAQYATKAGEGTTEAAKTIGYFTTQVGNATEIMGAGAANARAAWMGFLTPFIKGLNDSHQGLLMNVGGVMEFGTKIADVVGPAAGAWMQYRNFRNLATIAEGAGTIATTSNTIATNANTIAVVANGNAAVAAATKVGILARARAFATGPGGIIAGGLIAGGLGYAALQSTGVLGKDAPGLGEAVSNTMGRIGAFFSTGRSSSYDERIQKEYAEEQAAKAQQGKLDADLKKQMAAASNFNPAAITSVAGVVAGTVAGEDTDVTQSQIDALQDTITRTKDKNKKAELQIQLRSLQRAKRDADKMARANEKEKREEDRQTEIAAKSIGEIAGIRAKAKVDELRESLSENKEIAADALEVQIDAIRKAMKSGGMGKDAGQAKIDRLQDAFDKRQKAIDASTDAQIARIEAEAIMAEARTVAATQEGAEQTATLNEAREKAASRLRAATRASARALRYGRDADEAGVESGGGAIANARQTAIAALARLRNRGAGGSPESLKYGSGGLLRFPTSARAQDAGQMPNGNRKFTVELIMPDELGQQAARLY